MKITREITALEHLKSKGYDVSYVDFIGAGPYEESRAEFFRQRLGGIITRLSSVMLLLSETGNKSLGFGYCISKAIPVTKLVACGDRYGYISRQGL
ncbi:MAG: hypothetical protein AAB596_02755 [Patescibacteria group bacterium]